MHRRALGVLFTVLSAGLGLISVFYHLNDVRRTHPLTEDEVPRYTVKSAADLRDLVGRLENED